MIRPPADGARRRLLPFAATLLALLSCGCRSDTPPPNAAPPLPAGVVLPRYSEVVAGSGENLAYDRPAATIDPRLTEHSRAMAQRIYRTGGNVYCAVGYGLANMTMLEGPDGIVIVDTLESVENARAALAELRTISSKPLVAVIYTHNHYDHVMGAAGLVAREDVAAGRVPIYAQADLMRGLTNQLSVVGEAIGIRSLYMFGSFLQKGPTGSVNEGIGPTLVQGTPGFIPPTQTFEDRLEIHAGGLRLELIHAPSETDDELVVWMPDTRVLQSAEVIQGETYPNLYTIRGTTYRDPVQWYRTIDRLRELEPAYLVPSHGRPVEGEAEVASLLTAYRDAIQYTHDQAVRLINRGYTADEVAAALPALPPHLAAHPWVAEFYGTVRHSVRNVYGGYLGWFQGDPTWLDPLPPAEQARRTVVAMGGREAVLDAARQACSGGEYQWCAELATHLVRLDAGDRDARGVKAQALRQLGLRQMNVNWRNFYLTAALELEGDLPAGVYSPQRALPIFEQLPLATLLEKIVTRVDPQRTADVHMTLGFHVTDDGRGGPRDDSGRDYALEIRRGVVQLHEQRPAQVDVTLRASEGTLRRVLLRQVNFAKAALLEDLDVDGSVGDVQRFFSYFDPPAEEPAALAGR